VLTTAPRDLMRAHDDLQRFGVMPLDLDALLVHAMKAQALALRANWDVVLRADAAPRTSPDWRRLQALVVKAVDDVTRSLLEHEGTVLLTSPGLLARYDQMPLLDRLHQALGTQALRGVWVLVPTDGQQELPT